MPHGAPFLSQKTGIVFSAPICLGLMICWKSQRPDSPLVVSLIRSRHYCWCFMWEHPGPFFSECPPLSLGSQSLSDLTCRQYKHMPADLISFIKINGVYTGLLGELKSQAMASVGTQEPSFHATGKGSFILSGLFACTVDYLLSGGGVSSHPTLLLSRKQDLQLQPQLEHTARPLRKAPDSVSRVATSAWWILWS